MPSPARAVAPIEGAEFPFTNFRQIRKRFLIIGYADSIAWRRKNVKPFSNIPGTQGLTLNFQAF
jgi:hypothetical protein